jgi:hypothetical protein
MGSGAVILKLGGFEYVLARSIAGMRELARQAFQECLYR